jgi:hypothetical protein
MRVACYMRPAVAYEKIKVCAFIGLLHVLDV